MKAIVRIKRHAAEIMVLVISVFTIYQTTALCTTYHRALSVTSIDSAAYAHLHCAFCNR